MHQLKIFLAWLGGCAFGAFLCGQSPDPDALLLGSLLTGGLTSLVAAMNLSGCRIVLFIFAPGLFALLYGGGVLTLRALLPEWLTPAVMPAVGSVLWLLLLIAIVPGRMPLWSLVGLAGLGLGLTNFGVYHYRPDADALWWVLANLVSLITTAIFFIVMAFLKRRERPEPEEQPRASQPAPRPTARAPESARPAQRPPSESPAARSLRELATRMEESLGPCVLTTDVLEPFAQASDVGARGMRGDVPLPVAQRAALEVMALLETPRRRLASLSSCGDHRLGRAYDQLARTLAKEIAAYYAAASEIAKNGFRDPEEMAEHARNVEHWARVRLNDAREYLCELPEEGGPP